MQKFYTTLFVLSLFITPLLGVEPLLWERVNASILMSQLGTDSPLLLTHEQPASALYSIEGTNTSIFNPEYLQEAVLGIAFNEDFPENTPTAEGEESPKSNLIKSTVGCGCYQGGFGGIAGTAGNSGGGGSFSIYAGSSNYSLGGMGFGGGGGGGSNPPNNPPEPPNPPTPPVYTPEPGTWLTLGGVLSIILIWKGRFRSSESVS